MQEKEQQSVATLHIKYTAVILLNKKSPRSPL